MAQLLVTAEADEFDGGANAGELKGYSYEGDCSVRIANDAAENGYDQDPGPLTWLNSARITADPQDDAVHCVVSIGDPRGGFCFTVRRMQNGQIVIHTPDPSDGMAHMATQQVRPGTLIVGNYGAKWGEDFKPGDYSDPEPAWIATVKGLPRERLQLLLDSAEGYDEDDDEAALIEDVIAAVKDGTIDKDDIGE